MSYLLTDEFIPADSGKRVWLISAIGYCLFSMLSAPWYRPPRDALTNTFAAGILLAVLNLSDVELANQYLEVFRWMSVGLMGVIFSSAITSIILFGTSTDNIRLNQISRFTFQLSNSLGKGEIVFSPPVLIGVFAFYQTSFTDVFGLVIVWFVLIVIKPFEHLIRLSSLLLGRIDAQQSASKLGEIIRIDHPDLIRVSLRTTRNWKNNVPVIACLADHSCRLVVPISNYLQESGIVGTGLICKETKDLEQQMETGFVYRSNTNDSSESLFYDRFGDRKLILIGHIVEQTSIGTIRFEIMDTAALKEGTLVCCHSSGTEVFYQVLDARTDEESINSNPSGKLIGIAAQLGRIDDNGKFVKHGWLPHMNSPVFVPCGTLGCDAKDLEEDEFIVGMVPDSEIYVVAGFNDLLEYHSAILGVTGTGKTELSFDIIKKALSLDTKVFCVDFTNEYSARLSKFSPKTLGLSDDDARRLNEKLFAVDTGTYGAGPEKKVLQEFVDAIREPIRATVEEFLSSDGASLGIFELPEITNTKATLRATEIYLSSIMEWARKNRRARKILVVLEEAHTIIPETMGAGFDHDTQWVVSKISQIALQGRKYGVGLLIISQRTALVSKSILSQCNTHFTFSLIDKTSLDFLSNVHSPAHVKLIPNLSFLDVIANGKAIRSERPIRVKIAFDPQKAVESKSLDHKVVKTKVAGLPTMKSPDAISD